MNCCCFHWHQQFDTLNATLSVKSFTAFDLVTSRLDLFEPFFFSLFPTSLRWRSHDSKPRNNKMMKFRWLNVSVMTGPPQNKAVGVSRLTIGSDFIHFQRWNPMTYQSYISIPDSDEAPVGKFDSRSGGEGEGEGGGGGGWKMRLCLIINYGDS